MPQFNLKNISSIILFRLFAYVLVAGGVAFYFKQNVVSYPQVNLSLQTARPELIQIYCDAGSGFNETLSSNVKTSPTQQSGEPFSLSLPSVCKRLRLDFGDAGAVVKIITASLVTADGESVDILGRILSPGYFNQVELSEANHGEFIATANDPYVVLNGEFLGLTTTGYSYMAVLKMLIIFMMAFCGLAVSDYWANRKD